MNLSFMPGLPASVVQKLVPPKIKRTMKGCLMMLYRPHRVKRTRLTENAVRYAIRRQQQKGENPSKIAAELGMIPGYVRILWASLQNTGRIPVPRKAGRPKGTITQDAVRTVLEWHGRMPAGVVRPARRLKAANQGSQSRHKLRRSIPP